MPYFEDVELGDPIGPVETAATDEGVAAFCAVWHPPQPNRFTSLEAAQQSGMAYTIVPGIMTLALLARLFTDWAGPAALKDLDVVFRQPVPHHAPLFLEGTITDLREDEDGAAVAECDVLMTGAQGERYVGGRALVALPRRP